MCKNVKKLLAVIGTFILLFNSMLQVVWASSESEPNVAIPNVISSNTNLINILDNTKDIYEPNNKVQDARTITSDTITATIGNENDVDWYKKEFKSGQEVDVVLQNIPQMCNYDLLLLNKDLILVAYSGNNDNGMESIKYRVPRTDTYFICVVTVSGYDADQNYTLRVKSEDSIQLGKIKAVSTLGNHTLALKEDGTVIAFGDNQFGQCNIPEGLTNIKMVSAGYGHSVALKEDGTLVVWGDNTYGQCNIPKGLTNVKAISAGYNHTTALIEDGAVVIWGDINIPKLINVKAISSGDRLTVVLNKDGSAEAVGFNYIPKTYGLENAKCITVGSSHAVALNEDGTVVAWGDNKFGQCNIPEGLANVKAISAAGNHTVALKEDGTVVAWGSDKSGVYKIPEGLNNIKAISTGYNSTVAIREDGTVVTW